MPKKDMDYSKTIIYKIVCNDITITDCYIGHTTNFIKRKYQHKHSCINEIDHNYYYYVYQFIRENGGWENWCMIQIEEFSCNNLNEACARERHWIETLKATLNKQIPNGTKKEWREKHKIEMQEYQKQYRINNLELKKDNDKLYYQQNKDKLLQQCICECGSKYTYCGKSRHLKTKKHQDWSQLVSSNINQV
jgi:hypothetical protein